MIRKILGKLWSLSKVLLFLFLLFQYADKVPSIAVQPSCITWHSSANFAIWDFEEVPLPNTQTKQYSRAFATQLFVDHRFRAGVYLDPEIRLKLSFNRWLLRSLYFDQYIIAAKRLVHQHQWEPYLSKEWVGRNMVYSEDACRDVATIMTTEPPAN